MDFKRIQIIFLIVFVVIDIFLFSLLRRNQDVQTENLGNNSASVITEMHNDQITFASYPTNYTRTGYYIAAHKNNQLESRMGLLDNQTPHYSHLRLQSTFKRPIALSSVHPHHTIDHLLADPTFVSFGSRYHYSPALSNHRTLVYVQHAAGRPVFSRSGELRFHVEAHLLSGYTQSYLSHIRNLREKANTISGRRTLALLYQYNDVPNGTRILWTRFAYTRLLSVKGNYVYIPAWVVAMKIKGANHVSYKCVNAFSGSVINFGSRRQALANISKN